jgi:lipopolysaccharide transport system permease protein
MLTSSSEPKALSTEPTSSPSFDVVIRAGRVEGQYWRDLIRYRELLMTLAWRDIAVRYKQTAVGILWVIGRPILTVGVLCAVFGKLSNLPSGGVPYPLLVLVAFLPWQLFSNSLSSSTNSLVGNSSLISKVYFPRLLIPLSSLLANVVDFGLTALMLIPVMLYYGYAPGWPVLFAPLFVLLALGCAAGFGLWLGALNVRYRDVNHIVPFLVQLGLYISPVGYNTAIVPERWRFIFSLNPLVGIIDGFRWSLLGPGPGTEVYWPGVIISAVVSSVLFIAGVWYFRRTERTFADII